MTHSLVLVLGGVRSGKSRFAQTLAERAGGEDVLFVATAEAKDDEMACRIDHHRRNRPSKWSTLERPWGTGDAIHAMDSPPRVILVDCLTLLVSNVLLQCGSDAAAAERRVTVEVDSLLAAARHHKAAMIVVSGEVGQGVVPDSRLGRLFRDLLGWANQRLAEGATCTYLMVAGLAIEIGSLATSVEQAARALETGRPHDSRDIPLR